MTNRYNKCAALTAQHIQGHLPQKRKPTFVYPPPSYLPLVRSLLVPVVVRGAESGFQNDIAMNHPQLLLLESLRKATASAGWLSIELGAAAPLLAIFAPHPFCETKNPRLKAHTRSHITSILNVHRLFRARRRTYDTFQSRQTLAKHALLDRPSIAIQASTSSIAYVCSGPRHSNRAATPYRLRCARCSVPRSNDLRTPPSTIRSLFGHPARAHPQHRRPYGRVCLFGRPRHFHAVDARLDLTIAPAPVFLPALVTLCGAYPALAPRFRAWFLTTIASTATTLSTLPFIMDYATRGGVAGMQMRADAAVTDNRFFQAYLCADMIIAIRCAWAHILSVRCYGGAFLSSPPFPIAPPHTIPAQSQLPTFLLGVSALLLRSNATFPPSPPLSPPLRPSPPPCLYAETPVPRFLAVLLSLVFPLYAMRFKGCVAGFIRRYHQGKAETIKTSEMDGGTHPRPPTPNVYPDARSRPVASIPPVSLTPYAWAGVGVGVVTTHLLRDRLVSFSHLVQGERWLAGGRGRGLPPVTGCSILGPCTSAFSHPVRALFTHLSRATLACASSPITAPLMEEHRKAVRAASIHAPHLCVPLVHVLAPLSSDQVANAVRHDFRTRRGSDVSSLHVAVPAAPRRPPPKAAPTARPAPLASLPTGKKARKPRAGCEIENNDFRPHVAALDRLRTWTSPYGLEHDAEFRKLLPPEAVNKTYAALFAS
ncbi:hypothetical protein B0H14DRAFT_3438761 [Mycena olivaceomarginata]|nr:hypothetical protein B0H14DRAFT_3438761 [Mycena olivaceomarginata]